MNAVEIAALRHRYRRSGRAGEERVALDGITFSVSAGEIFGLLGPNGGGKTTLFRILSTILAPTNGTARIFGEDVAANPVAVRRSIGVVFQNPSLDKKLTVRENLLHQGHLYGLRGPELENRLSDVLARFRIADRAGDLTERLSGGLQRRVEIAKGLLHKPRLLLLDEPSTGLDPAARRDMWDSLSRLRAEGVTVLFTTHLMEEGDRCDRIAILHGGRLVAIGTPEALKSKIGGDVIRVHTSRPEEIAQGLKNSGDGAVSVVDGTVRIERRDGHRFIPQLVEKFPGAVEAVSVGKPTLEDVFIHETGEGYAPDRERSNA